MNRVVVPAIALCAALAAPACTLGASDLEPREESRAVAAALSDAVSFQGGTLIEDALPATTAPDVVIQPLTETVIMAPNLDSIMALDVDNPNEDADAVAMTLIRFASASSYIEVQASTRQMAGDGSGDPNAGMPGEPPVTAVVRIENPFTVAANVCDELCDKLFAIDVTEIATLRSGEVGVASTRQLVLDCREAGSRSACGANTDDDVSADSLGDLGSANAGAPAGGLGSGAGGEVPPPSGAGGAGAVAGTDAGAPDPVMITPPELLLCGGIACQCADGIDNDGDGNVDGFDFECTGAGDDTEGDFGSGIPGDNMDPMWADCHYDGNSGSADDDCRYSLQCLTGMLPQADAACQVTQGCVDNCRPLTPNGCDCFGCCTVLQNGDPVDVLLGDGCESTDPGACGSCIKSGGLCQNLCGECELCPGKTLADLPPQCGGVVVCDDAPGCTAQNDCDPGLYCSLGCCIAASLALP